MKRSNLVIMDAISDGFYNEEWIYSEKDEFELKFNKPWHGADSQSAKEEVGLMISSGHIVRKKISGGCGDLSVIGLTSLGGATWERGFNVVWDRYCDVGEMVIDGVCRGSCAYFISEYLAEQFRQRCVEREVLGEVIERKHWEWSNWKIHDIYYAVNITLCKDREGVASLVENLRNGWRKF